MLCGLRLANIHISRNGVSLSKSPKTARAVHANRGIEAKYRKQLQALIAEMQGSFEYWLTAAYRKFPPVMADLVAQDASVTQQKKRGMERRRAEWMAKNSPSKRIKRVIDELGDRWAKKFDEAAPKIAEAYLLGMYKTTDSAMRASLKDAGWAVEFKMTPAMRDNFSASLAENVGLIKSIPEQYLGKVEGAVMRSYSAGRDLETMVKEIRQIYPVTQKRAELIARDQSNKANAVVNRTRQLELGITEAIWMHSHAGKEPRPDHLAANGKKYNIAEGCLISGEYIYPGEEINCRCTSRPVLPI